MNNIILRSIEREDLDLLFKWRNDESIFSQLGGGYFPTSKTEMSKWMDNFSKLDKNNIKFIIECDNESIGFISLNNINYVNRIGELGIYIGERKYHGRGIATKALQKLEHFSKNTLNLRKIKLLMNDNNTGALKLYNKNHYRVVGKYKQDRFVNGELVDVIIMEKFL